VLTVCAALATAIAWGYYAVVNPTVGGAIVAAVASVVNTVILARHDRHVDRRFDERRNVIVKGTADDPGTVLVTTEDRRELADRRANPETRKERGSRRQQRRK
jgi:uncharacterized membrane protein